MTSSIRFYLDENVANEIAQGLRTRSIDVITTAEAGHIGFKDEQQLSFALAEQRVFVTQDEDFLVLHSQGVAHAGIAYYKQKTRSTKQVIRGLVLIYDVLSPDEMVNHVEFL
jgi:predicted nuclease of predicted toxin-antitoxin system